MNVVALPKPSADERLVTVLEELLADARAGKVRSFVGVAFHRETHFGQRYAHNAYTMEGIGACSMLLSWITSKWEDAPNLPEPGDPA